MDYKYFAFISYKSDDVKWAKWLQKKLESYSLPVALQKKNNIPKKLGQVFRDGTDILPKELKSELNGKLEQSRYLIVLCSPRSAASVWVGDEIDQFCRMGRRDNIISVIIEGRPYSKDPATECYHPKMREWFPKSDDATQDRQLLGADINSAVSTNRRIQKERAFIQVVATMLNLPFDDLWNRRRRQMIARAIIAIAAAVAIIAAVVVTWMAGRPFDVNVAITEQTPHNADLPFENGKVALLVGDDTLAVRQLANGETAVSFANIPGKFKGEQTRISFDMYGFEHIDTMVSLAGSHDLAIRRDGTFGTFAGNVYEDDGETPVAGATVNLEGESSTTDEAGYFCIELPVEKQSRLKKVEIGKDGYLNGSYNLQPQADHCLLIFKE